jgi:hypothetical protein
MAVFQVANEYNPEFQSRITNKTKLAIGINMAKFLGGYGSAGNMNHISEDSERLRIAKQYSMHANAMRKVMTNQSKFNNYRLVIAEGLYKPSVLETVEIDSINFLKSKGRAVVYELRDLNGNIAHEKTFDLAVYWKDNLNFESLILSYDSYNYDRSITAQIILVMPEIIPAWNVTYKNEIMTMYNNNVQTNGELVEILNN